MDIWTFLLIILLVVALLVVTVLFIRRSNKRRRERDKQASEASFEKRREQKAEERANRCPIELEIGSTVGYDDKWYEVTGKVSYNDAEGYTWFDYRLKEVGTKNRRWISVEQNEEWEATLWSDLTEGRESLPDSPSVKSFTYDGTKFRLDERGRANYKVEGQTDFRPKAGSVDYVDYVGDGGRLLSYEKYDGGGWEVSVGQECNIEDVMDLPKLPQ